MNSLTLRVPNISCGHCVHTIQTEVSDLAGVKSVIANADSKSVTVTFEPPATQDTIEAMLAEINYPAEKLTTL